MVFNEKYKFINLLRFNTFLNLIYIDPLVDQNIVSENTYPYVIVPSLSLLKLRFIAEFKRYVKMLESFGHYISEGGNHGASLLLMFSFETALTFSETVCHIYSCIHTYYYPGHKKQKSIFICISLDYLGELFIVKM